MSLAVLIYDLCMVTILTLMFVIPLTTSRGKFMSPAVRHVAVRSLAAAVVSMVRPSVVD